MSLPRYPEYKDSGVEWLGEIPTHWRATRLKQVVHPQRPITYGIVQAGPNQESGVPYIRPTDMTDESGVKSLDGLLRTTKEIAKAYSRSSIASGEIVCSIGPSFGKVMVTPPELDGANLTQGTARISVKQGDCPRFVFWLLRSVSTKAQWEVSVGGATFRALNLEPLAETVLAMPTQEEQQRIADFIDRATAKIDALIAGQEKLLALLAEKRLATISHAVTRGLNPDAPMKDSGIPWIGDVPAHWAISSLGRVSSSRCDGPFGSGIKSDHYTEEGALVVRLQNIRAGAFNVGDPAYLDQQYFETSLRGHEVVEGDLLVAGLGDDNNLLGRACVAPAGLGTALVKADCFRFRLRKEMVLPHFAAMQLSAGAAFDAGVMSTGTTRSRMPLSVMATRNIALPPLDEQSAIASFVDSKLKKVDVLKDEAEVGISLLKERRNGLIAAAVTGKIDVRGAVVECEIA